MKRLVFILLAVLLSAFVAASCAPGTNSAAGTGKLAIQEPWARPAKAGETSAIYFVIDNPGTQPDTLTGVQCDAAMMAEMHLSKTDAAGKTSMVMQKSVPVLGSGQTKFEPGGLHIMLMNLKQDLEPGQKLAVTLHFEKGGAIQVEAIVCEP